MRNFNPRSHEGSDGRTVTTRVINIHFNPRSHEGSDWNESVPTADSTISIHAPTKGATIQNKWLMIYVLFQSTLPRRERQRYLNTFAGNHKFQSTLPRRERRDMRASRNTDPDFNPRSHEGSDGRSSLSYISPSDFNPRSHEGSDYPGRGQDLVRLISIHAPTKGATCGILLSLWPEVISIHAPTKGATMIEKLPEDKKRISIHAPTKGATIYSNFNLQHDRFQSTLPRRERRTA